MKYKNRKKFIILYSFLIILVFGIIINNQLTRYFYVKKQLPSYDDIVGVVKNAANNYIKDHEDLKTKFFYTNYFIDIKIKYLKDGKYLKKDLYNPKTDEYIKDDEIIRLTYSSNNLINIMYPVKEFEEGYHFIASKMILYYDEIQDFCNSPYNIYKGLFGSRYEGITNYKMGLIYYSKDTSISGTYYTKDYFTSDVSLKYTSCNVNDKIAGNYKIDYTYIDPLTKETKTFTRDIVIKRANTDIKKYSAIINDNKVVDYKTNKVKITIKEEYINGNKTSNDYFIVNENGFYKIKDKFDKETRFTIKYFSTDAIESNMKCILKPNKTNSDGSVLKDTTLNYSVDLGTPNKPVIKYENDVLYFTGNESSDSIITYYYGLDKNNLNREGNNVKITPKIKNLTFYVKACNASKCSKITEYTVK